MKDTQISVFLVNRTGELARMTAHLARFNINIKAISTVDATDHAVIRMITNDADKAAAALLELNYGFIRSDVIVVEIPDRPGSLSELCAKLSAADINIRYIYGTVTPGGGVASAVINTDDNDAADKLTSG
ncbi:MAG: ACT domain-containing protein [Armatimonadota bacterium]